MNPNNQSGDSLTSWVTTPSPVPKHRRNSNSVWILTDCPSTTPFGLALGPTNPEKINFTQGNLRFSADMFLACLIATYTGIITSVSSTCPYGQALSYNRTLPYQTSVTNNWHFHPFGNKLSPGNFRCKTARPVSCYALFKRWLLLSQLPGCICNFTSFTT